MEKFPKKILILSNVPPSTNSSGGLVLVELCRFLPKDSLVNFVTLKKDYEPQIPKDLNWIPIKYAQKPREGWSNLPVLNSILSFFGENYIRIFVIRRILADIVSFGKKHQINCLWVILDGQTLIRLALPAAKKLNVPLISQIWDPPEWGLKDQNVDKFSRALILKKFAQAIHESQKCATASWAMAKKYAHNYHAKTMPFLPSLEAQLAFPPASRLHSAKELIIGMAGQIYVTAEWDSLILALDKLDWQINDQKIKIRLLGNWLKLTTDRKMTIEYLGWRSQEETLKLMNECDILYCPYWFDPKYEKAARLSFPSKLTTYLAAGRPIFFHGPEYASPAVFLRKNQAAAFCYTLKTEEIIKILRRLKSDRKYYGQLAKNGRKAFDEYLTSQTLRRNFAEFLQIDERELVG